MNKNATRVYTVSGPGKFPIDMLRYDRATPLTKADAKMVERTHANTCTFGRHHPITLTSQREPTVARWESFGWQVDRGSPRGLTEAEAVEQHGTVAAYNWTMSHRNMTT
jgi:hypothetical protein